MPTCSKCGESAPFHELTGFEVPADQPCKRLCFKCVQKEWTQSVADHIDRDFAVLHVKRALGLDETDLKSLDDVEQAIEQLKSNNQELVSSMLRLKHDLEFRLSATQQELERVKSELNKARSMLVGEDADASALRSELDEAKQELDRVKTQRDAMREALQSSGVAFKKMADGLDRVKAAGESACELGVEVAATFRKHQSECESALSSPADHSPDVKMVPVEKVRPLVQCIQDILIAIGSYGEVRGLDERIDGLARKALQHAKELGL